MQLVGVVSSSRRCLAVIELCELGSLKSLLDERRPVDGRTITAETVIAIAFDVATGMAYLYVDERHFFFVTREEH